jgi:hypothetical protein
MLVDQLGECVAEQELPQHLDHRLSPRGCGDEQALEQFVPLLLREALVEVTHLQG